MAEWSVVGTRRGQPPGVYFESAVSPRPRGLQTAVPLFVGFVSSCAAPGGNRDGDCRGLREIRSLRLAPGALGSACRAVALTAWEEFGQCVGEASEEGFLDYAVKGFFENGGERCVVVAVDAEDKAETLKLLFRERGLLENVEEPDLVCVPDLMSLPAESVGIGPALEKSASPKALIPPETILELQLAVLDYCRRMGDRFAILDSGPGGRKITGVVSPGARLQYEQEDALLADQRLLHNGAMYYPWLHVKPLPRHAAELRAVRVPPCGHVAGIYARTDAGYGIHKAPANETLEGVLDLERHLTDGEQSRLNDVGVNCLRSFPGRGIRVWGARTLSGHRDWRYVSVRRLFLNLVRWCERECADLVFEVCNLELLAQVRERMEARCLRLLEAGALKGMSREEAFFVKCDTELNTLEVRSAGQVICEVGLAAVAPAEFITVRINQSAAGVTALSPGGT
jgi:uncharacterized protein